MNRALFCATCNQIFGAKDGTSHHRDGQKCPLLLQCGHSFCEACMRKLAKIKKTNISCPSCQKTTPIRDGDVKNLPYDIYLLGLTLAKQRSLPMDLLKPVITKRKHPPLSPGASSGIDVKVDPCCECSNREATLMCLKCECNMCSKCFEKIHKAKILQKHQAVPLHKQEMSLRFLTENFDVSGAKVCERHNNRPFEYYCEDDHVAICSRCVIVGDHREHAITPLEEKNQTVIGELVPAMKKATIVMNTMRKTDKELSGAFPDLKIDVEKKISGVKYHFHRLHSILQSREQALIELIHEAVQHVTEPVQDIRQEMAENLQKIDNLLKEARVLRGQQSDLINGQGILDELQAAASIPCVLDSSESKDINIECKFDDDFPTVIRAYGDVIAGDSLPSFTLSPLLNMPDVDSMDVSLEFEYGETESGASPSVSAPSNSSRSSDVIVEDDFSDASSFSRILSRTSSVDGDVDVQSEATLKIGKRHLNKSRCEAVVVTHIKNPCHFYIQLMSDAKRLASQSEKIHHYCKSWRKKEKVSQVEVGELVLALFTQDGVWYRARVKLVHTEDDENPSSVEVLYFDFGNSEVVPLERILKMPKKFGNNPEFSILCSLVDIVPVDQSVKWSQDAIDEFDRMTTNSATMMLTIHSHDNIFMYVDLCKPPADEIPDDRPVSVRDALVFMEVACFTSEYSISNGKQLPEKRFFAPDLPRQNTEILGQMCYCLDPSNFYIQMCGDYSKYFRDLTTGLQKTYKTDKGELWSVFCPRLGMVCVVKNPDDQKWYRAHIVGLTGKRMLNVELVDVGCSKIVSVFGIKKVLENFMKLPAQALLCKLADIEPLKQKYWSEEATVKIKEIMWSKELVFNVKDVGRNQISVIAYEVVDGERISINGQLVRYGLAISTGPGSIPQPVNLSAMNMMNDDCDKNSLTENDQSLPVVSVSWAELAESDKNITSNDESSEPSECSSTCTLPVVKENNSDKKPVVSENVDDSETPVVSPKLKDNGAGDAQSEHNDEIFSLKVSSIVSPSEIYLQTSDNDELKSLMSQLQVTYKGSESEMVNWEVDNYCVACYSKDNLWYRGKIVAVNDNQTYKVHILDYGHSDVLSHHNLRSLDEKFIPYPCFALRCCIDGIQPAGDKYKWSQTSCDILLSTLHDQECQIIKKGDMIDDLLPVDIRIHEVVEADALNAEVRKLVSVRQILINKGVALPLKRKDSPSLTSPSPTSWMASNIEKAPKERKLRKLLPMEYLPHEMPDSSALLMQPTYVDYSGIIYAQDVAKVEIINTLMGDLQLTFQNSKPEDDVLWEVGNGCTALYVVDNNWYRARIVAINPEKGIQVVYIDFGNSEFVSNEQIRSEVLHPDVPAQCLEMTLHKIAPKHGTWTIPLLDHIHNLVVGKLCNVAIMEQPVPGRYLEVVLETEMEINIAELLLSEDFVISLAAIPEPDVVLEEELCEEYNKTLANISASYSSNINGANAFSSPYTVVQMPNLRQYFNIVVTNIITPNFICCQYAQLDNRRDKRQKEINKQLDKLLELANVMNENALTAPPVIEPVIGMACLSQFTVDNCWYRSEILGITEGDRICDVRYVDYGNAESVPFENLREIYSEYLELPAQGMHFSIDGVEPPSSSGWPEETFRAMDTILASGDLIACITDSENYPPKVQLYKGIPSPGQEAELAYQPLLDAGLIKLTL